MKAQTAENYVRITKSRLYRIMEANKNFDWLTYLKPVQMTYNKTPQVGKLLGHSPLEVVSNEKLETKIRRQYALKTRKKYLKLSQRPSRYPALHKGSRVRYLLDEGPFQKQYLPQFSTEIETITKIIPGPIVTYKISNHQRRFYREELSLTTADSSPDLYKIYQTRKVAPKTSRSGLQRGEPELEYLISPLNADKKKWTTQAEVDALQRNGLLHNPVV